MKPTFSEEPMNTSSAPPEGLQAAGLELWSSIADTYELDEVEREQLAQAARQADVVAALEAALADSDLIVTGSQGQPRPSPLLTELRGHRALLDRLLSRLKLPSNDPAQRWRSSQASQAARARWGDGARHRSARERVRSLDWNP